MLKAAEPLTVTPGTVVPGTTTIDSLFNALYANRSANLTNIVYQWGDVGLLQGVYSDSSMVMAHFEARPVSPSVITLSSPGTLGSGGDSITGSSTGPVTIPAIGASVSVPVVMPWVDGGDTVSLNDGTRQFKGTVLSNTGSALIVLNPGYGGNSAAGQIVASASPVTLCSAPIGFSDVAAYSDDFIELRWTNVTNTPSPWSYAISGSGGFSTPAWSADHIGQAGLNCGGATGAASLMRNMIGGPGIGSATVLLSAAKVCLRFVVMCDVPFSSASFDGEWMVGFSDTVPTGSVQYAVLLSHAPGATGLPGANGVGGSGITGAGGLLAGTYNNVAGGHYGYIQTGVGISGGTWYELIISVSSTSAKFYVATYGTGPALVATITDNIPVSAVMAPAIGIIRSTGSGIRNLYVDRYEEIFQGSRPRFLGENLFKY